MNAIAGNNHFELKQIIKLKTKKMKSNLLLACLFYTQFISAQMFVEISTPFENISSGEGAFADVNGDQFPDVLLTGYNDSFKEITKLYINDGLGNFTEMFGTPFKNIKSSSIAFVDIDLDSDQDIALMEITNLSEPLIELYINDGLGNFKEQIGSPFPYLLHRDRFAFSDVNGDQYPDVLFSGDDNLSLGRTTKIYKNRGMGNSFVEINGTPFPGVTHTVVAFSDVNGDQHNDLLLTGYTNLAGPISKLYINDGFGNFTERTNTPFKAVVDGAVAFSDVNGDNYPDVLIFGETTIFNIPTTNLYINDGLGNFTEKRNTPFEDLRDGVIAFSDVNIDQYPDVLLVGTNKSYKSIAKLYINDGLGNFTEKVGTPFLGVISGSVSISDVNNDQRPDVLITGQEENSLKIITKLYINNEEVSQLKDTIKREMFEITLLPLSIKANSLNINFSSETNCKITIKIFDLTGRLLKQQVENAKIGGQIFSVDITNLSSGNYILELYNGEKKGVQKFLIP